MYKILKKKAALVLGAVMMLGMLFVPHFESKAAADYSFGGTAHVQNDGDKAATWDGTTLTLGTTGQSKRLESVTINFVNNTGYDGGITYRVHRQDYGWTGWVDNGQPAGTTGESKRLEAIQLELTGEIANHYSIRYRVHIQNYGWNQGWQYDGALAGTEGESKRLEALEIQLVPKSSETMEVIYRVHRQTYGWEALYKKNGEASGTMGESKRLEGIEIALTGNEYSGDIIYSTHVQNYGWMNEVKNGMMSGTSGQSKRLEAITIRLTGEIADYYDVYYRVHAQDYGWLGWAKNGECAGTSGQSKRLEAIQIVLMKKEAGAPGNVGNITSQNGSAYIAATAGHEHSWEPVYDTRMVQQYADDGTTNDYSKPITEEKPIYDETPIWETHLFNNGVDCTVAVRNYNATHGTNYIYSHRDIIPELNDYLSGLGATSGRTYSDQVQVGTERVQVGTETVTVGYEQLGKKEEKYISGYRCSCGATK